MPEQSHQEAQDPALRAEQRSQPGANRGGPAAALFALQRTAGNRAVSIALQRTVTIGPTSRSTYEIEATSLDEAMTAMEEHSADEAAQTSWSPTFSADNDGTNVTAARVEVPVAVEMPSWPGSSQVSRAARAEWTRFRTALGVHEDGHVSRVQTGFARSDRRLLRKTPEAAETEFGTIVEAVQSNSDAFDTQTDHGRNNGTVIDTSIT
jgi:predicted secreted Zn-dependent protease